MGSRTLPSRRAGGMLRGTWVNGSAVPVRGSLARWAACAREGRGAAGSPGAEGRGMPSSVVAVASMAAPEGKEREGGCVRRG